MAALVLGQERLFFLLPLAASVVNGLRIPLPRTICKSGQMLWPIMEGCGVEIRAIWPYESMYLRIEPYTAEELFIS